MRQRALVLVVGSAALAVITVGSTNAAGSKPAGLPWARFKRYAWTHGEEIKIGDFLMFVVHWQPEYSDDGMLWGSRNMFRIPVPKATFTSGPRKT